MNTNYFILLQVAVTGVANRSVTISDKFQTTKYCAVQTIQQGAIHAVQSGAVRAVQSDSLKTVLSGAELAFLLMYHFYIHSL